jgi:cytidine deaminase
MAGSQRIDELSAADQELVAAALAVSARAYAPYSGFAVGAAVRTRSGTILRGANLENASYGVAICAEVSVLTMANATAAYDVEAMAVVGHKFTSPIDASQIVTPCGRCRQMIFEASQIAGTDTRVLSCSGDLQRIEVTTISQLLPSAFGPHNLGLDRTWVGMRSALEERVRALQGAVPTRH